MDISVLFSKDFKDSKDIGSVVLIILMNIGI